MSFKTKRRENQLEGHEGKVKVIVEGSDVA